MKPRPQALVWGHVSHGKWGFTGYGRQGALAAAIARLVPVVNLSTRPGGIFPKLKVEVIWHHDRLIELHGVLGMSSQRGFRKLGSMANAIDRVTLHRNLRRIGVRSYAAWLCENNARIMSIVRGDWTIYDCIDPCFIEDDLARADGMEEKLFRESDMAFVTAKSLEDRWRAVQPVIYRLPNAASDDAFSSRGSLPDALASKLNSLPRPIVGYLGTVDWRFNAEIVRETAARLPQMTFLFGGRVNHDQEARLAGLRALANVVFVGSVPQECGAAFLRAIDVGLIPFMMDRVGHAINPVKMYSYLAAGKPVVATDIQECRGVADVWACSSSEAMVQAIGEALASKSQPRIAERRRFAFENTWLARAARAVEVLQGRGIAPPADNWGKWIRDRRGRVTLDEGHSQTGSGADRFFAVTG